jgi:hypothetical protein
MTTRTKLYITSYTTSALMLLNVFSKPLHIPEAFQWALIFGNFIPIGLMFYLINKRKFEAQTQASSAESMVLPTANQKQLAKKKLVLNMVLGSAVCLCGPLWLPLTGTSLGIQGNFVCSIFGAVVVCTIYGIKLRNL